MDRLLQAIYFATLKHLGQNRKDRKTPYISHPLAVGLILSRVTSDKDIIIAGILHDVIEDTETTEKEIQELFGTKVAKMVMDCSEKDKSKSWKDRKQRVLDNVKYLSESSALVKSADSLHNMYELKLKTQELGLSYFDNFNASAIDKMVYERKKIKNFKRYHKDNPLLKEIDENLKFLELQLKGKSSN